jgi:hypothetical protein
MKATKVFYYNGQLKGTERQIIHSEDGVIAECTDEQDAIDLAALLNQLVSAARKEGH